MFHCLNIKERKDKGVLISDRTYNERQLKTKPNIVFGCERISNSCQNSSFMLIGYLLSTTNYLRYRHRLHKVS